MYNTILTSIGYSIGIRDLRFFNEPSGKVIYVKSAVSFSLTQATNMATILVIEDEQILSETLGHNLERAGFTVELAADGIVGLEQARRLQPDLIILDIMLPGLDGFSVCRTITRESAVPIIILTALQDEAHRIAGLELGAIDYVIKPFSMGE